MSSLNLSTISKTVLKYMLDEVSIQRPSEPTLNATTLVMTKAYTTIYEGVAFVAPMGSPGDTSLGGQQVANTQFEIALPADTDPIMPNDEVTVTSSQYNEQMVGATFIVTGQIETTFLTHRRLAAWRKVDAS